MRRRTFEPPPTLGKRRHRTFVDQRFVTTAWGRDYADVPPLKGIVVGPPGATSTLDVAVGVVPEQPEDLSPASAE